MYEIYTNEDMDQNEDLETYIMENMIDFNYNSVNIADDLDVLYRVVCSAMQVIEENNLKLSLFKEFSKGTIFTRTCKATRDGRYGCGTELTKTTTFTNLTPLGNIMINNPKTVNDSVVFFRTTKKVKFLDFTIISQLFGVQLKSGVPPSDMLGDEQSRGLLSICCKIPDMQELCLRMGVVGVIQIDSADGYYFNEDYKLPENFKQGTGARMMANELVLDAIMNKCAYPIIGEQIETEDGLQSFVGSYDFSEIRDNRLEGTGALFPEFNFHVSENLEQYLSYCDVNDDIFQGDLHNIVHEDIYTLVDVINYTNQVPYFNLNEIFKDEQSCEAYLTFQMNKYKFQQISDWEWVTPIKGERGVLKVDWFITNRTNLINNIFNNYFVVLPYLCYPEKILFNIDKDFGVNIHNIEYALLLYIHDGSTLNVCGKKIGAKTIYKNKQEEMDIVEEEEEDDEEDYGGKKIRKRRKINLKKSRKNKRISKKGCSFIGVGAYKYQQKLSRKLRKTNKRQRNKTNKR